MCCSAEGVARLSTAKGSLALLCIDSAGCIASLSVLWAVRSEVFSRRAKAAGIPIVRIGALGEVIGPTMLGYISSETGGLGIALRFAAMIVAKDWVLMVWFLRGLF